MRISLLIRVIEKETADSRRGDWDSKKKRGRGGTRNIVNVGIRNCHIGVDF